MIKGYNVVRKLIKMLIPNKGDMFFNLFEDAAKDCYSAAQNLVEIIKSQNETNTNELLGQSRIIKNKSNLTEKKVLEHLNQVFITPIDRGDIQEISDLLNKLTKRIVKISIKMQLYSIDAKTDDCLIRNANTLLMTCKVLVDSLDALKSSTHQVIALCDERMNELEEDGIEDLRAAINEIYSGKFDTLTILKLKEIYKSIDTAIETAVSVSELIHQVSIKSI